MECLMGFATLLRKRPQPIPQLPDVANNCSNRRAIASVRGVESPGTPAAEQAKTERDDTSSKA
jgi:hypothetical protein